MNINIILIYFLTACECKIQINIFTSNYFNKPVITFIGSDIKQVTEKEIELFKITNENLNKGIRVEMGKVPDEVFLKDPTTYGDVFSKFKWPEVRRKLSVRKADVVEFIKEDVVLKISEHINNTTSTIDSNIDIVEAVINTVRAIWNKDGLPDDVIHYKYLIDFGYGRVMHQAYWRDANANTFNMMIEKSKDILEIESGKSIVTKLLAEKVIMLVEIELYAHLIGNIVANYGHLYGKYHFWSPTIGNIMSAAKLKNEITTKFMLEVRYHANPRLEVMDKDTGMEVTINGRRHQNRKTKIRKHKLSFS